MLAPRSRPNIRLVEQDNSSLPDKGSGGRNGRDSIPFALPGRPRLAELFAASDDMGAAGFALAQIPRRSRLLWVQQRMVELETGRPCGAGLERFGVDPDRLVLACASNAADVLWTMEEGLKCRSLTVIAGELWGNPRALDFTATKRLAFRAERQEVHIYLIRVAGRPDLSAARERWNISSCPSVADPHNPKAPGRPRWQAELFRARGRPPGLWQACYDPAAHRLDLVPALSDGALAEAASPTVPIGRTRSG